MPDRVNKPFRPSPSLLGLALALPALWGTQAAAAAKPAPVVAAPRPAYPLVADLVTSSQAIAVVNVSGLTPVPADRAPGLAPGMQRYLVSAQTISLIRSNDVLAKQSSFLLDLPGTPKSKPPRWKGRMFLIFGKVEERVDFFQLLSSDAILAWSQDNEAMVRRIADDLSPGKAPPQIKGVDSVFHVSGSVQGEGETQVFLSTANGSPISLSIVRKPDEKPQFGVSLGEVVDDAAAMPKPETPLWYRLACSLPVALPGQALAGQAPADASAATKDYAAFMTALGPCDRTPQPIG